MDSRAPGGGLLCKWFYFKSKKLYKFYESWPNIVGRFLPQMVGFVGFCVEKTLLLGELPQLVEISLLSISVLSVEGRLMKKKMMKKLIKESQKN